MQNELGVFSLPARFLFLIFIPALFFMQEKSHRSCERWDSVLLSNVSA